MTHVRAALDDLDRLDAEMSAARWPDDSRRRAAS
jgi:hypothetical protein